MARIVHVTTSHDSNDNRIFHKECLTLRDTGHEVTLIAQHDHDEVVDGIRILALPRYRALKQRILKLPPVAMKRLGEVEADLVHYHDPELIPHMAKLRGKGPVLVYDMHENLAADIPAKSYVPQALKPLARFAVPRLLRSWLRGQHVVFAVKEFPALYPWAKSYAVVQNLFKLSNLPDKPSFTSERFTLGYLGGMTVVRGCLLTLEVLEKLQEQGYDVGYEAVGPEMEGRLQEYKDTVANRELKHVHFTGALPLREAYAHCAGCQAGLLLFQPSPNHENCCPNKLFEYMALGLPVVASNFSLIREVVEATGCGIVVDPLDVDEIVQAIEVLIRDPAQAAAMGERGREAVHRDYSWQSAAKNLLGFYEGIL